MKYKQAKGFDIGKNNQFWYIWVPCKNCGEYRWIYKKKKMHSPLCLKCYHTEHSIQMTGKWKGEKHPS